MVLSHQGFAQWDNIRATDSVYWPNIHSGVFTPLADERGNPIIRLGSADQLKLSFDDFAKGTRQWNYSIVQCNFDWTISDLMPMQYTDGYTDDVFNTYKSAVNTLQRYTTYSLLLPNQNIKPTKSGNYLLIMYADYDKSKIVLTRRFYVVDAKASVTFSIKRPMRGELRNSHQEIDFDIGTGGLPISRPFDEVKVRLMQNWNPNTEISDLQPLFVEENRLRYHYDTKNVFAGGNEFNHIDLRNLRYKSQEIREIFSDSTNRVYLKGLTPRNHLAYSYCQDLNGKYIVYSQGSNADADYAKVHVYLVGSSFIEDGNVYVEGAWNNWKLDSTSEMTYLPQVHAYEAIINLKQGYYDFRFTVAGSHGIVSNSRAIDGDYLETENEYEILVYFRPIGSNYDQLVSVSMANSMNYVR